MSEQIYDRVDLAMQSLQDELARIAHGLGEYDALRQRQARVLAAIAALNGQRPAAVAKRSTSATGSLSEALRKVLEAAGAEGMTSREIKATLAKDGGTYKSGYINSELSRRSSLGQVKRDAETGRWALAV
jgi:hypothetical protein